MKVLNEDNIRFFNATQGMSLFGNAAALFAGHPIYAQAEFGSVAAYLASAIRHQQLKCYFSDDNQLTGMVIWMWLDEALLARIQREDVHPPTLHISEWKEGDIFFVADVVAHRHALREIIRDIRTSVPTDAGKVAWINHRRHLLRSTTLHKRRGPGSCKP